MIFVFLQILVEAFCPVHAASQKWKATGMVDGWGRVLAFPDHTRQLCEHSRGAAVCRESTKMDVGTNVTSYRTAVILCLSKGA